MYKRQGDLLIPIGISFYTFQLIALVVDSRSAPQQTVRFVDLMNFGSFFPQIVAGPIERKKDLMPQLSKFEFHFNSEDVLLGIRFIIVGLFYKLVLGDNLASLTTGIHKELDHPLAIHLSNFLFAMRIYADFCGYSLIAYGVAKCIGVNLQINFMSPYTACNLQDFWRRWHITLSNWFRDYVYIPLGGNKSKWVSCTVVLVFTVSGVWHGSGWNFVFWGLFHGFGLVALSYFRKCVSLPQVVSYFLTMIFVSFSWLFFYQSDVNLLFSKVCILFDFSSYLSNPVDGAFSLFGRSSQVVLCCFFSALSFFVIFLEFISFRRTGSPYSWSRPIYVHLILVFVIIFMSPVEDNGFVYFNF